MELIVKIRSGQVTERQQAQIEEQIGKLARYLDGISKATVELSEEQRRGEGLTHRAQVTLTGAHGILLRAEQRAPELYAAIDQVHDTLQRQIRRYKEKHFNHSRARRQPADLATLNGALAADEHAAEALPRIVRTKAFQVKPMSSDEAVEQMELLGHDFFVFRDAGSDLVNVLYRREDGNYGLIVADTAG